MAPTEMAPSARSRGSVEIEAARAVLAEFGQQLEGPRQVTRLQMVHFLARQFGLSADAAEYLFQRLAALGMVVWINDRDEPSAPTRRRAVPAG